MKVYVAHIDPGTKAVKFVEGEVLQKDSKFVRIQTLGGPIESAVIGKPPYGCPEIEKLFFALKDRIRSLIQKET